METVFKNETTEINISEDSISISYEKGETKKGVQIKTEYLIDLFRKILEDENN